MSGKAIIIVGGTGAGKTTWVKTKLKKVDKKSILLYDVNNEYKEFTDGSSLPDFDDFSNRATRVSNAVIVFEEATIFLSNQGSNKNVRDILVRKRHTNNTIFLVFHSLRAVPRNIFDLCNYVVLHKTNDNVDLIDNRFDMPELTDMFTRIKNAPKYSYEIFDIYAN